VVLVANSIEKLAIGLKSSFSQYKSTVIPALLEKMKEKKSNVLEALRNALDSVFGSVL
jgi:hypothetical protein